MDNDHEKLQAPGHNFLDEICELGVHTYHSQNNMAAKNNESAYLNCMFKRKSPSNILTLRHETYFGVNLSIFALTLRHIQF